ncbi:6333_t:CDS:2, partial [Dentiscutata erythropus]
MPKYRTLNDTVVFNVGGTNFQIQRSLVQSYPNSYLATLANSSEGQEIFVDHNPLAFSVILDFLRYKHLMVPKNVAQDYDATIGNSSLRDTVLQASTR